MPDLDRVRSLFRLVQASSIAAGPWHWLRWHLTAAGGGPVPFGVAILASLAEIDEVMPGYGGRMIARLAAICGREKNRDDYDQIVSILAEILVVRRLVNWGAPLGARFRDEPTVPGSRKNPEVVLELPDVQVAVEVKTARLRDHARLRASQSLQFAARTMSRGHVEAMERSSGPATKPRDNPVKDFLLSAEEKFRPIKAQDPNCACILVIVWDDFAFEVATALAHERVGLLTPNTWLTDASGNPISFPSIDAVVVSGHQIILHTALRDVPPFARSDAGLDWLHRGMWFGVVAIDNPAAEGLREELKEAFAIRPLTPGETQTDFVIWSPVL